MFFFFFLHVHFCTFLKPTVMLAYTIKIMLEEENLNFPDFDLTSSD